MIFFFFRCLSTCDSRSMLEIGLLHYRQQHSIGMNKEWLYILPRRDIPNILQIEEKATSIEHNKIAN